MVSCYYPFDYSGENYLSVRRTCYCHSERVSDGRLRIIECDIEEKWMKVKERFGDSTEWNEIDLKDINKGGVVYLDDSGCKWEGDSLNGKAFGYGFIYNSINQLIYKGFMFEGRKVCFGSDYFGNVESIEYEGNYYRNLRSGYGKLYNKNGELIYEGELKNGNSLFERKVIIENRINDESIHFGIEELIIEANCLKSVENFKLVRFNHLKRLVINDNRLMKMKCFCIGECNELIDIKLSGALASMNNKPFIYCFGIENQSNSVFQIYNCKNLLEVTMTKHWLENCDSVELCGIMRIIDKI